MYLYNGLDYEISIDANVFKQNSCFRGVGFYEENSYNLLMTNNIFLQNTATGNGGGRGGAFRFNGSWTGVGNIIADPGFTDENYHIDEFSPCEDAGIDSLLVGGGSWYFAPPEDFEGTPRPWHMGYDIGADECDIIEKLTDYFISGERNIMLYNYPNPISDRTAIEFYLPEACQVSLKIYDLTGREVSVLVNGLLASGQHTFTFETGELPGGIYLLRLAASGQRLTQTKKLVLKR